MLFILKISLLKFFLCCFGFVLYRVFSNKLFVCNIGSIYLIIGVMWVVLLSFFIINYGLFWIFRVERL